MVERLGGNQIWLVLFDEENILLSYQGLNHVRRTHSLVNKGLSTISQHKTCKR